MIKYGILGCGKHALHGHALHSKDIPNLELTAVCDLSQENMELFETVYGSKLAKFTDRDAFFDGIDAVLVATPDEFHFSDLKEAINKRKHAFVEKPLATNSKDFNGVVFQTGLRHILLYAEQYCGLTVTSCHPRRFDPPFVKMKEFLPSFIEDLGKVVNFLFDFSYHKPSKYWKHNRGLLLDHANHEIDLVSYLLGHCPFEAKRISDSYNEYNIMGNREDGISFQFIGTRKLEARNYLEWLTIRFEKGMVVLDIHKGNITIRSDKDDGHTVIRVPPTNYEERGRRAMLNFAKAISGEEKNYLTSQDLYVNTALCVMLSEYKTWKYEPEPLGGF